MAPIGVYFYWSKKHFDRAHDLEYILHFLENFVYW